MDNNDNFSLPATVLQMFPRNTDRSIEGVVGEIDIAGRSKARMQADNVTGQAASWKSTHLFQQLGEDLLKQRMPEEISRLTTFRLALAEDCARLAKAQAQHDLTSWVEETSALHFSHYGAAGLVPLWLALGDWNCPPIDHDYVVRKVIKLMGEAAGQRYRDAVAAFDTDEAIEPTS